MSRLSRVIPRLAPLALLATLAGCGGGLYVDISDPYNGPPPEISITASSASARRGDIIRLSAAVSASNGIDRVTFFRIDPGVSTSLAVLYGSPLQVDTPIPFNAGSSVAYWARVCDRAGLCSESPTITVSVP